MDLSKKEELTPPLGSKLFNYIGRFVSLLYNLLNRWNFLELMFSKNDKILNIDNPIAPGHWTHVAQLVVCTPMIYHDDHSPQNTPAPVICDELPVIMQLLNIREALSQPAAPPPDSGEVELPVITQPVSSNRACQPIVFSAITVSPW